MSVIEPFFFTLRDDRNVVIRSPDVTDAARLLEFLSQIFRESDSLLFLPGELSPTLAQEQEYIARHRADDGSLLVCGFDGQCCVGVCSVTRDLSARKLSHHASVGLSVLAQARGAGLGGRLLRSALEWADSNPHLDKLTLDVFDDNPVAVALYRRHHFVSVGRRICHFRQPDGRQVDQVLMERYRRTPVGRCLVPN